MILQFAVIIGAVAAGTVAWRGHPILAIVLFRAAALDIAREALGRLVLRPERERLLALVGGDELRRAPFAGVVRFIWSVDQALYLAGPATVAAFAVWAFSRRLRGPLIAVASAWVACSVAVACLYPQVSGLAWAAWPIGPAYRCAHALAALATIAAAAFWFRRFRRPELRHRAAFAMAGGELLVAFAGPYAWGGAQGVWTRWTLAGVIYLAVFTWIGWHCRRLMERDSGSHAD